MLPGRDYSIGDYGGMAWRHRWAILACTIVGLYVGLLISSQLEDVYQSEMLVQVVPQRVPDEYVRSSVRMRTEERLMSLSQQVMSRTQLEHLIDELGLYPRERASQPMQDVVQHMRENIEVAPAETGADAFYVRFSYSDRETATLVTERLGSLFINTNARDRGDLAQATNDFLQTQLEESRTKLEEQERRLEDFRQRNAGRLPTQLDFNMQAIHRAQMELQSRVEAVARDRDRKLILERLYQEAQGDALIVQDRPNDVDPYAPLTGTPAEQLVRARANLDRLRLRLTPEHPDILRAERTIRDLEERVAAEPQTVTARAATGPLVLTPAQAARRERINDLKNEIDSIEREIRAKEAETSQLRGTIAQYQRRIEQVPELETEWIALTRDYDTQQAAYKSLLTKSEDAQVATDLERRQIGEQFRVIDPARPPVRPTGIARVRVNAIGALAGLVLGLLIAGIREWRDTTFKSPSEIADVLNLPLLALIPYLATDADRRRFEWQRTRTVAATTGVLAIGGYVFWRMELWKHIA